MGALSVEAVDSGVDARHQSGVRMPVLGVKYVFAALAGITFGIRTP